MQFLKCIIYIISSQTIPVAKMLAFKRKQLKFSTSSNSLVKGKIFFFYGEWVGGGGVRGWGW